MTNVIEPIIQYGPTVITALCGIVTAATAITIITPSKVDDNVLAGTGKVLNILLKIVNILAGNFGKNKNADAS